MITDSGLLQQVSTFAGTLDVKDAPSVEKTADEQGQEAKVPEQSQGDTVSISEDARALAAVEKTEESEPQTSSEKSDGQTLAEKQIQMLKDQIERLEEEIKEIEEDDRLTEKQKLQMVQAKQVQLMELNKQLSEAQEEMMKNIGATPGGGTRANGFGNSLKTF